MWYLLATSLAALSLNKSLAYLILGLTAFLGWKQGILDAPALLVIASIVVGWSAVEWLRNKNNKYNCNNRYIINKKISHHKMRMGDLLSNI